MPQATPTEVSDSALPFSFPAVLGKKVTAAFDGGRLTSDGGALLLSMAERALGICDALAACVADRRDPTRTIHSVADIFKARALAIACGYEDADDLDSLRHDPAFRLALGKLVEAGPGLASQPTMRFHEEVNSGQRSGRLFSPKKPLWRQA